MNTDTEYPRGLIVRNPEPPPTQITITNPHYGVYEQQPNYEMPPYSQPKRPINIGQEMAIAIIACVIGVILFILFKESESWYYGVAAGIGSFILLRCLYGCYTSKENSVREIAKPASEPTVDELSEDPTAPV